MANQDTPSSDNSPRIFRGKVVRHARRPGEKGRQRSLWSRRMRSTRRFVVGIAAQGAKATLLRMPDFAISGLAGSLVPLAKSQLRAVTDRNLERVFGHSKSTAERAEIRDQVYRYMKRMIVDWVRYTKEGVSFIDRLVDDTDARRKLAEFEAEWPGGFLVVGPHFGNWELAGQWVFHRTSRPWGGCIAKRQPNPRLNRVVEEFRGGHGMATIYRDDPPSTIVRRLRAGSGVGIVPDQTTESAGGVFIDFLGHPAYTPLGPARLAVSCNVPMVLLRVEYLENGYRAVVEDPIWPDRSAPRDAEILALTHAWSNRFEQWIRDDPAQWQWGHDRWRLTPADLERKQRIELKTTPTPAAAIGDDG